MRDVRNFRWHARAGQGAVTASKALADIAAEAEGRHVQAFAEYGAEKRGAPIRAFNRISTEPVRLYCSIEEPNWIVCMDPTLVGSVDIVKGAVAGSTFLFNTPTGPEWLRDKLNLDGYEVYYLDATGISMDTLGRDIPNSAILGAIVKASGIFDPEKFAKNLEAQMRASFSAKIADANMVAYKRGYEEVKKG